MAITAQSAIWFLPFALPISLWVIWSDLSTMRIPNTAVLALTAVFAVLGLIVLPWADYPWRWLQLAVVLCVGILANAGGMIGAGDAKFAAAAAPLIALGDVPLLTLLFSANLIAAFITHRVVMRSALCRLAPNWVSWSRTDKFPMGFALGGTLSIYLGLGAVYGA